MAQRVVVEAWRHLCILPPMGSANSNISDEELIQLAYAMALGPQRYEELFTTLKDRISTTLDDEAISPEDMGAALKRDLSPLETHFDKALSLMQDRGRQRDTAPGSIRVVESDTKPSLLLDTNGKVHFANDAALSLFDLRIGVPLSDETLDAGHRNRLLSELSRLDAQSLGTAVSIFDFVSCDDQEFVKMALSHVKGGTGETLGLLTTVHISWYPKIAQRFKELFDLTKVELEITKAVVTGMGLTQLATSRRRSVGTVRQQAKKLLSKLNLHSQTELVSLYSGFSKFTLSTVIEDSELEALGITVSQHILTRPDQRIIDYECVGPEEGNPVIFIPALLGGNTVTEPIYKALTELNIRLIMPWRPGLSQSGLSGEPDMASFERYANDLSALMGRLEIHACPIIGHITGTLFAYAAAKYVPDRVQALTIVNGIVPTAKGAHVSKLERGERVRLQLIRSVPRVGRMIVHGMMAKVDAGFDEEFLATFLDNELDLQTVQDPLIRSQFRKAFSRTTLQGYNSFMDELIQSTLDWRPLMQDIQTPITWLVGANNPIYTPDFISAYMRENDPFDLQIIPETAHLLYYQRPRTVLQTALRR
ncbi:MAG: alpha/beta hydrolase [Pseudomonadota bacterium]